MFYCDSVRESHQYLWFCGRDKYGAFSDSGCSDHAFCRAFKGLEQCDQAGSGKAERGCDVRTEKGEISGGYDDKNFHIQQHLCDADGTGGSSAQYVGSLLSGPDDIHVASYYAVRYGG